MFKKSLVILDYPDFFQKSVQAKPPKSYKLFATNVSTTGYSQAFCNDSELICKESEQESFFICNESELERWAFCEHCGRFLQAPTANYEHYALGRNCALFHRLRFWAYDWVVYHRDENGTTFIEWMEVVLVKAESFNTFPQPLPYGEIKSTAKSVGRWVWDKYYPKNKRKRRGVMAESFDNSDLPLDLKAKQRLSARRTHELRRVATEEKIIKAIGQLTAAGQRVTKSAVSRMTGLNRENITRHFKHLFVSE